MKALVYGGPGTRSWTEIPDPAIQDPRDAIIRVDAVPQAVGFAAAGQVGATGLGRDDEAGWHRQPEPGHLGEARALAPQQTGHRPVPVVQLDDERLARRPLDDAHGSSGRG
jgi:hypothetical protein